MAAMAAMDMATEESGTSTDKRHAEEFLHDGQLEMQDYCLLLNKSPVRSEAGIHINDEKTEILNMFCFGLKDITQVNDFNEKVCDVHYVEMVHLDTYYHDIFDTQNAHIM